MTFTFQSSYSSTIFIPGSAIQGLSSRKALIDSFLNPPKRDTAWQRLATSIMEVWLSHSCHAGTSMPLVILFPYDNRKRINHRIGRDWVPHQHQCQDPHQHEFLTSNCLKRLRYCSGFQLLTSGDCVASGQFQTYASPSIRKRRENCRGQITGTAVPHQT